MLDKKKKSKRLDFFISCVSRIAYETEIRAERVSVSNRACSLADWGGGQPATTAPNNKRNGCVG